MKTKFITVIVEICNIRNIKEFDKMPSLFDGGL